MSFHICMHIQTRSYDRSKGLSIRCEGPLFTSLNLLNSEEFPVLAKEHLEHFDMDSLVKTIELHKGEFESMVPNMEITRHVVEKMLDLLVKEENTGEEIHDGAPGVVEPVPETLSEIPEQCIDESRELLRRLHLIVPSAKTVTCLVTSGKTRFYQASVGFGKNEFPSSR